MKKFTLYLLLACITICFTQCQKELSYIGGSDTTNNNQPAPITATVQGNVLDENGQPASGVAIQVGSQSATTDARGYFRIKNAALDKNASLVTADKTGYFKAYRTFSATSGTNQVVIKLIPKTLAGTVSSTSGGDVSLSNGTKVSLPANGVQLASGGTFSGTVNVYAAYINPTAADMDQIVPGSLMANDKDNKRVTLASYGMVAVVLESSSGQALQIKSGSQATLTMPIPASLQSSAPATIALWSVDEQTGIWKEEGSATKSGGFYSGNVSHFSFWNCDIGIPAINVSLTLKNNDALPIVHGRVRIKAAATNPYFTSAYGYTDSLGQVSGLVPSGYPLVLEVLDQCNNVIYSQNIGPFSQNTNLGVITVTGGGTSIITVKGHLANCTGGSVTSGFAIIYLDNMVRYDAVDANGDFQVTFITCASTSGQVQILAVDEGAQQQGSVVNVSITSPITNAGTVAACGTSATQFINYTLDGVNYSINNPATDSLMGYTMAQQGSAVPVTTFMGFQSTSTGNIYLQFDHPLNVPGTYQVDMINVADYDSNTVIQPFNVVVDVFPQIGGFYEGSFNGNFKDQFNITHSLSGTFRIRRSF